MLPQANLTILDRFPDVPTEAKLTKHDLRGKRKDSWDILHKRLTRIYQKVSENVNDKNFKEQVISNLLEYFGRKKQEPSIDLL
ncbi:MAG: hypothetical protein WBM44_17145 [Waterburya sp.]